MNLLGIVAALALALACPGISHAQTTATPVPPVVARSAPAAVAPAPGVKLAEAVSATTGLAISPLLGVGAVGAWQYWQTPSGARDNIPWHAHPWFWFPALLLVVVLALKEPVLYFLPGAKKPLDLLEVVENKASALVAAPIVIHLAIQTFSRASSGSGSGGDAVALVTAGWAGGGTLLAVLCVLGLLAAFFCVWMVSHAINILILLSPSATLDMLMRASRGFVLGAVAFSSFLNPWLGLLVAAAVIFVAVRCFGWSWRLMVYGMTLTWDWLTGRKKDEPDARGRVRAFLLTPRGGLPVRARGWLATDVTGELVFRGRPLPWLPSREIPLPARQVRLVRSLTGPVLREAANGRESAVAGLPPRFSGAEARLGARFGIDFSSEHPTARTWQATVRWLVENLVQPSATRLR